MGATSRQRLGLPFAPVISGIMIMPSPTGETLASPSRDAAFKNEVSLRRLKMYEPLTALASSFALPSVGVAGAVYGK